MPGNRVTLGSAEESDSDAEDVDAATEEMGSERERWERRFSCDEVALLSTVKPRLKVDEETDCWVERPMRERRVVRRSVDLRMLRVVLSAGRTLKNKIDFSVLVDEVDVVVCRDSRIDCTGTASVRLDFK
jgi:hypothetical protein